MHNGKAVDTGSMFLGSCIGHRSCIGSGVVVSPGREIPNGARIIPGGSRVLSKVPTKGDFTVFRHREDVSWSFRILGGFRLNQRMPVNLWGSSRF